LRDGTRLRACGQRRRRGDADGDEGLDEVSSFHAPKLCRRHAMVDYLGRMVINGVRLDLA
jgi:hypothetical protein